MVLAHPSPCTSTLELFSVPLGTIRGAVSRAVTVGRGARAKLFGSCPEQLARALDERCTAHRSPDYAPFVPVPSLGTHKPWPSPGNKMLSLS